QINIVLPLSFLFLLVYIVEISLKILALGPIQYFKKFWNMCDFVVITISLIAACLELHPLYHSLAVVRPIKLIRIIRLKKRYRDIMNTMVVLTLRLISVSNVSLLLIVIFYFFAIVGMEAFQYQVTEGCCVNASYSVGHNNAGSLNSSAPNPAVYHLNNFDNILRSYVTLFILLVVNNWYIIMEGFASEVSPHWTARIYFFSFYIVTLVVLQVVISFIVEAYVLQLEEANHCKEREEQNLQIVYDTDCVEDEHRKKEVRITLHHQDIKKLNYLITYTDERRTRNRELFSFDRAVKKFRRINLPTEEGMQCSGRRLRTKDDLHLLKYRADIQVYLNKRNAIFRT
ncbi:Two pore calcium channel protein 1, partial [Geodia barretti]